MNLEGEPDYWVDEWPLPGLSASDRAKIKAALLRAHATFLRGDFNDPNRFAQPLRDAFDAVAKVLFEAKLLSNEILERHLRLFILEAAIAGGWIGPPTDKSRTEIFSGGYLGYESNWREFRDGWWHNLLAANTAEWKSRLLEAEPSEAVPRAPITPAEPKALRDFYFAAFPDEKIKILDVCWAAGQHYREWKRWMAGALKSGSTADLAFRRILTSGKRPTEYKTKPRPAKWQ